MTLNQVGFSVGSRSHLDVWISARLKYGADFSIDFTVDGNKLDALSCSLRAQRNLITVKHQMQVGIWVKFERSKFGSFCVASFSGAKNITTAEKL